MSWKNIFLVLAVLSAGIALGAMFLPSSNSSMGGILEGIFKGLAGTFFILYYILMLLGKQPADKTGNH